MQEREEIRQLFERYRQGRCTPEEQVRLHAWFNRYANDQASGLDELSVVYRTERIKLRRRHLRWISYAAAALVIVSTGWYLALYRQSSHGDIVSNAVN